MTGADWLRRLRAFLDDLPGDRPTGDDYDPQTCAWSPDELIGYWNAGWEELSLRSPIEDASSALTLVTVPGGVSERAALDASVLFVDRVTLDGAPLSRLHIADLDAAYVDPADPWEAMTGTPTGYLIEQSRPMALRLFPAPVADTELRLTVRRGPRLLLAAERLNDELADPLSQRDGQAVIWWAASLAYQRPDADTYSADLAAQNAARFEAAVGPRPDVRARDFAAHTSGRPAMRVRTYAR